MPSENKDIYYMKFAIEQAKLAEEINEVPVGAIVVYTDGTGKNTIVSSAFNTKEDQHSPSAHAEFKAIEKASQILGRWRLSDCTIYVTLEPCLMCAGLMQQARISRCVFGAYDPKGGALGSLYSIHKDSRLNHNFTVTSGVCERACADILTNFFKKKRESLKNSKNYQKHT